MSESNTYLPYQMRVVKVTEEAPGVKTFRLEFVNEQDAKQFSFKTGQFGEYSVYGEGESTFCIASPDTRKGYVECTFRQAGRVTSALSNIEEGEIIGFRGPYGNHFPIDEWKGKNLVFIAGGIALPPMRSVIWSCLDNRSDFKDITVFYGAKTVADLVYKNELEEWKERDDINLFTTVDPGGATPEWKGEVGYVPSIVDKMNISAENTIAIVCGPPIMIKNTFPVLKKAGFTDEHIFTTLENRMKCGVGKCGRCNVGKIYVCKDGPVFSAAALEELPAEY